MRTAAIGRRAALGLLPSAVAAAQEPFGPNRLTDPAAVAEQLFAVLEPTRIAAARWFMARGNPDAAPVLIRALRFNRSGAGKAAIDDALRLLTGADQPDWFHWMEWQQAQPALRAFPGHDRFLANYFSWLDPNFRVFIREGVPHAIRLEEVVWGGVSKDGIPALTDPAFLKPGERPWTRPHDLVFGVSINGDTRAYPLRIMDWHEMFNDVVGGVPVSLAYCTLCGSGILFETALPGRARPFVFGSSGLLYRSNKLMYDQETHSLWNQFTGRPVIGPLTGSDIRLKVRPVTITSWEDWQRTHPGTRLLSLATGHERDYAPGAAYGSYFTSPDLMFPALVTDRRLLPKDFVFALRGAGVDRAWRLSDFEGGAVINDTAGILEIVLVGDAANRTVRAYRRDGLRFAPGPDPMSLRADAVVWRMTEDALVAADGRSLDRLPGHVAYWFAWAGYLGAEGALAAPR
jgi:hypothetical protein